jgi:hypothetical protein
MLINVYFFSGFTIKSEETSRKKILWDWLKRTILRDKKYSVILILSQIIFKLLYFI